MSDHSPLSPVEVEQAVFSCYKDILQQPTSAGQFHDRLRNRIARLAREFGLRGSCEYEMEYLHEPRKKGCIDVVWRSRYATVALFEIDSSLRVKSI